MLMPLMPPLLLRARHDITSLMRCSAMLPLIDERQPRDERGRAACRALMQRHARC